MLSPLVSDIPEHDVVYLDATLTPNRSLSPRAFTIVMGIVGGLSVLGGVYFWQLGAIPVVGFFGLDALVIWLAFRVCFRSQNQSTRVRVTSSTLRVDHEGARGDLKVATLPSAFAQVDLEEPVGPTSWITLTASGQAYVIGRFLHPEERKSFVSALRAALQSARAERHPA